MAKTAGRRDRTGQGRQAAAPPPVTLSLREWLAPSRRHADGKRRLRVGGCGHLLLSRSESHRVREQLGQQVLPELVQQPDMRLSLFVGLAPGADLLFLQTAADWLRTRGIDFEMSALLPVPVGHLVNDWVLRARDGQLRVSAAARQRMQNEIDALLGCCQTVVPLYPDDATPQMLGSRAFRQHQYRRLAAIIAQHADAVVAVLRPGAAAEPGGTAEIIAWRQAPTLIPAELRLRSGSSRSLRRVYLIDPAKATARAEAHQADDDEACLRSALGQAENARRDGNDLLCLDLVNRALQQGLGSRRLDYLRIQALADTGNVMRALDAYRGLDLDEAELDEDWLALHGRLEKDLGMRRPAEARRHFARAAQAYLSAYQRYGGYYSGINAASMLMLAGATAPARKLARAVLKTVATDTPGEERERYYRLVTRAEAALLLGRAADCSKALAHADALLPDDITRRSRTRQQLLCLCTHLGLDTTPLAALRLPAAIHLARHGEIGTATIGQRLPALLRRPLEARALLHLTLLAPIDLLLAERLQAASARLYLTLPTAPASLLRAWGGEAARRYRQRLQALLAGAEGVAEQRGFLPREAAWACAEAETMTLGLSRLTAARLGLQWQAIELHERNGRLLARGGAAAPPPRPATPPARSRMTVGLLFADFVSFRRLDEAMLPRYYREIMAPIAALIDAYGERVLVRKSWGDAIHLVTADAHTAAHIAADIQRFIEQRRLLHKDLLADLELRIAAHFAPAHRGYDPVENKANCYGTQLLFTARIEPVAPPGMIYVTEPFAARVALDAGQAFMLDYAGEVELAKRAGSFRLFALQRRD